MTINDYITRYCQLAFGLFVFGLPLIAHSQVSGCRDPLATNYDPSATLNDGSCQYSSTIYNPIIKVNPISSTLAETSGLQWAMDYLWSLNDGGGATAIYRIDTATDAILQTITLEGVTNVDWEELSFDGSYFYVGDFGNNADGARTDLKIYRFPYSAIPDHAANPVATISLAQIEVINFTYSDQGTPTATGANNTRFDCEAMVVDEGKIHLFTKNWADLATTHYVIDGTTAGTYVATLLETLPTNYLVTAASKVPGSNVLVLLGYQNSGLGSHFMHLLSDFSGGYYFNGNKRRIDLPTALTMGQAEGITFRNSNYGYISNEFFTRTIFSTTITVNQKLSAFHTDAFTPSYVLPLKLMHFDVMKQSGKNLVSWQFTEAVNDLQLMHSNSSSNYSVLQTVAASAAGSLAVVPKGGMNCYQLRWRQANGSMTTSNSICVGNESKQVISNLVLHVGGRLQLISHEKDVYQLRLLATDGRLLAQLNKRLLQLGASEIAFHKTLSPGSLVLLQVVGSRHQQSYLLRITN